MHTAIYISTYITVRFIVNGAVFNQEGNNIIVLNEMSSNITQTCSFMQTLYFSVGHNTTSIASFVGKDSEY